MPSADFQEPPWDTPLDVNAELEAIPKGATMKGLFILPMVAEARSRGIVLPSARDRYLTFNDYPLVEHGRVMVESAQAFFPNISTRRGLRKLGRAAVRAFSQTTIGKVMWASVDSVDSALDAAAKMYTIAVPSCRMTVVERAQGRAVVRLGGEAHCFLDSNHVGTLEGVLHASGANGGTVAVRIESRFVGEYRLTWNDPRSRSSPP
jgi:uncharacterized protein (TIGR02265 family)